MNLDTKNTTHTVDTVLPNLQYIVCYVQKARTQSLVCPQLLQRPLMTAQPSSVSFPVPSPLRTPLDSVSSATPL